MLAAAAEAAWLPYPPQLLAVTVLTSMDRAQLAATGSTRSPAEQALLLAGMAFAKKFTALFAARRKRATSAPLIPNLSW